MATLRKYGGKYNSTFCQLCGLSTDTKPTSVLINDRSVGLADGSEFIEMDTNKKYRYSADNATWYEVESGGGGGGSATLIDKTITANGTYNATDDGANGYKSVDVNISSMGIPKLFSPTSAANSVKNYKSFKIEKNSSETLYLGQYDVGNVTPLGDNRKYLVFVNPITQIRVLNQSYSNLDEVCVIFVAKGTFSLKYYYYTSDTTPTNYKTWELTEGKTYKLTFNVVRIQGTTVSISDDNITEYNEPISFTLE